MTRRQNTAESYVTKVHWLSKINSIAHSTYFTNQFSSSILIKPTVTPGINTIIMWDKNLSGHVVIKLSFELLQHKQIELRSIWYNKIREVDMLGTLCTDVILVYSWTIAFRVKIDHCILDLNFSIISPLHSAILVLESDFWSFTSRKTAVYWYLGMI